MKKIKLLHMYHDILDLYGDRGNIASFVYRSRARGIQVEVERCTLGEARRIADYDIVFMGGGADKEQSIIIGDLIGRKNDFKDAIANGTQFLLICGAYQLFGMYYVDASGHRLEGLGLGEYHTVSSASALHGSRSDAEAHMAEARMPMRTSLDRAGSNRCIGNILIEAEIGGERIDIIGFENHGGQTHGVESPLGRVIRGFGNNFESGFEGYRNGRIIGTYMHGPLLPKNPRLTDYFISTAIGERLSPLDDSIENAAFETVKRRLLG